MGQTIAEKIISGHAGKEVFRDELILARVDAAMASDTTAPLAIEAFRSMGGEKLWDPVKCYLVIDHAAPAPNENISNLHISMREFARKQRCVFYEAGEGICHQLMVEKLHVLPGQIFVGADSHTCTYGAIGAMGIGVGSTDLAAVWLTGQIWLKVPRSIKIDLQGRLGKAVTGKDLILHLLSDIGVSGATYQSLEFCAQADSRLTLADRLSIANMCIEAGAKTGFVYPPGLDLPGSSEPIVPDPDADYERTVQIDCSKLTPMVSRPHSPASGAPVDQVQGAPIEYAFVGTCVNGRLADLRTAAAILSDAQVHPNTRLIIGPASRKVFLDAVKDGTVETLSKAGATFLPPGCGPCVGTHNGIPGNGETVISTGNRNFKGRMGNPRAKIFLASPATVAASAIEGRIANPLNYLQK